MKKRKAIFLTIVILILGFILNFLFGIMPEDFKNAISVFSESIGLSYTLFWIICTLVIVVLMLFFVWKQVNAEKEGYKSTVDPIKSKKINVTQNAPKSTTIIDNKGDIHNY